MRAIICDRCGVTDIQSKAAILIDHNNGSPTKRVDLCSGCVASFKDWLEDKR